MALFCGCCLLASFLEVKIHDDCRGSSKKGQNGCLRQMGTSMQGKWEFEEPQTTNAVLKEGLS